MKEEPRWHATLLILLCLALYLRLPPRLVFGPIWMAPLLVGVLLVPLLVLGIRRREYLKPMRVASIALLAILAFFNLTSIVSLINDLVNVHARLHASTTAQELLRSGALIWSTNVLVFALWFWELDGGGPHARVHFSNARDFPHADFLFPQMSLDPQRIACLRPQWKPLVLDYVYLSFTNALAVSPTDTMPLSRWAKMLMLIESLISFVTVGLILARSVNILS